MTIKRHSAIWNDVMNIELTPDELRAAYEEQQAIYDREDVMTVLEEMEIECSVEQIDAIAHFKREYQDETGAGWRTSVEMAISACCE